MEVAAALAASMKVSIAELLGSQDDLLPKAIVVHRYVAGEKLVSKE
jgi:hypothetical protein